MIGLVKQPDDNFMITLGLPVGTHRFRFVVDNELRFSDFLPTATDQMGNFVNYIEITPENVNNTYYKKKRKATMSHNSKSLRNSKQKRAIRHPANKLRVDLRYLDQEVIPCGG